MEFIKSLWLDHQTQILIWLGLGLATGVVAKYIMPGKDKGGLITTTLIGICGSFLGGFIGNYLGLSTSSFCLLYTSPSPRDRQKSRMPSSA